MTDKYKGLVTNEVLDQSQQFESQMALNEISFPKSIETKLVSSNPKKQLRTSQRIQSILLQNFNEKKGSISSYSELSKNIQTTLQGQFRKAPKCFQEVAIIGNFSDVSNPEKLELKVALKESQIFQWKWGLAIHRTKHNIGGIILASFSNFWGQCETLSFRMRKTFFDRLEDNQLLTSLEFPFMMPQLCVPVFQSSIAYQSFLPNVHLYKNKKGVTVTMASDPRFQYSLSTSSLSLLPEKDMVHIENKDSFIEQYNRIYNKGILQIMFTHNQLNQKQFGTRWVVHAKAALGTGKASDKESSDSNNDSERGIFARLRADNVYQAAHNIDIAGKKAIGFLESTSSSGFIFPLNKSKLPTLEKFRLVNLPSYKQIGMSGKGAYSDDVGSQFYFTNQTKYYLTNLPFFNKIKLTPFVNVFSAFFPDKSSSDQSNLRLSAGIGLTYNLGQSEKADIILTLARFKPDKSRDEFGAISFDFSA